ncbi:MAG: ABC transporter substrate-binding protein, partial [Candidatus Zambryskibacteria bacterium]|nr:ABC transporter substrate-binding protein [Candidatus Zambryskibacteria bacterium]
MISKDLRALFSKRFNIPKERPIRRALRSFTIAEKGVFYFFTAVFILTGAALLWSVSEAYLVEVPVQGGTLVEGVVGNPRFINPVLALSEADKNLTTLVYSGLIRLSPNGEIINDLAESIEISENRLIYTITLKEGARFHDGEPVTVDDVIFTMQKIIDPVIKSPRRGNWDGVTIEKIDDNTLSFTLKRAYTPFIYNLTTGILPTHIWKNVSNDEFSFSQFNTLPIGSGPFAVERVERNEGGIPDYYELTPFRDASGREPYVGKLAFQFYSSETALVSAYNNGGVDSIGGISPENISKLNMNNTRVIQSPLPRIFAVFFNQSQSKVLANKEVRTALNLSAPKEAIVNEVLGGYATVIDGPIPAGIYEWSTSKGSTQVWENRLESARQILTSAGWVLNLETSVLEKKSGSDTMTLSFSISTGDAPELRQVADELKNAWERLGARVEILVFETGDLNQNVIRPRQFE